MRGGKRNGPEAEWSLGQIYSLYQVIAKHPAADFTKAEYWHTAVAATDAPEGLKAMGEHQALTLWQFVQEKTKNNIQLFKSLFKDYERTLADNSTFHEKIKATLNNLFFAGKRPKPDQLMEGKSGNRTKPGRPRKTSRSPRTPRTPRTPSDGKAKRPRGRRPKHSDESCGGPEAEPEGEAEAEPEPEPEAKGGSERERESEPETGVRAVRGNRRTRDWKVGSKKRFPSLDLVAVADKAGRSRLLTRLEDRDKKLLGSAGAGTGGQDAAFMKCFKQVCNGTVPAELLQTRLGETQQVDHKEHKDHKERKDHREPRESKEDAGEKGSIEKIRKQLQRLQKKFGKSIDEISGLFTQASGDVLLVERYLAGDKVSLWTELEDMALRSPIESPEYQGLLKMRGKADIRQRKAFLGI